MHRDAAEKGKPSVCSRVFQESNNSETERRTTEESQDKEDKKNENCARGLPLGRPGTPRNFKEGRTNRDRRMSN